RGAAGRARNRYAPGAVSQGGDNCGDPAGPGGDRRIPGAHMSSPLLKLENVSACYGESQVLTEVSLEVETRAAVALIGRNGVGKTTLLRTLIGAHKLSKGSIVFRGEDLSRLEAHRRARAGIGYVPQGRHIFPHLTVEENLATGLAADSRRGHQGS